MTTRVIEVEPFDLIVFGGTSDLSFRKLIPALYHRDIDGQIPQQARIIGISRKQLDNQAYQELAQQALLEHASSENLTDEKLKRFLSRLHFVSVDITAESGWDTLSELLSNHDEFVRVFYLAVAPELFGTISKQIGQKGLINDKTRIVVEKPIGKDGNSANTVNKSIGSVFNEDQIFRIDHYLGKETVQNLMALRFANALFEPIWNSGHIDHVQITVAESLGVGSRVGYYDTAGAMRDMIQNHLLQLLCLVAMEPPASLDANSVRDEKLKVLRALKPIEEQSISKYTVRGQYTAGAADGGAVPGYLEELGKSDSKTETFTAIKAQIENWRWTGVPFYLRTGKRLAKRVSDVVIHFKDIPHSIFDSTVGQIQSNLLVIRLQPDEGVMLKLMIKDPGIGGMRLRQVPLDMSFAEAFNVRHPDAYERLVMDVVRGNPTLFMRRDEVEAAWNWCDPILQVWEQSNESIHTYTAGSWGPSSAIALIERDGRTWYE